MIAVENAIAVVLIVLAIVAWSVAVAGLAAL